METIRAFIALDIPVSVKSAILEIQDELKTNKFTIKWVRPENMHLTLRFLGDISPDAPAHIKRQMALAAADIEPFTLRATGVGAFPHTRRPRVVITEVGGDCTPLKNLKSNLDRLLEPLGFPKESKAFRGHLTLGRVKGSIDSRRFSQAISPLCEFETHPFTVNRFLLYGSDLKPTGPVYTKLAEAVLGSSRT